MDELPETEGLMRLGCLLVAAMRLVGDVLGFRVMRHAFDPAAGQRIGSLSVPREQPTTVIPGSMLRIAPE